MHNPSQRADKGHPSIKLQWAPIWTAFGLCIYDYLVVHALFYIRVALFRILCKKKYSSR